MSTAQPSQELVKAVLKMASALCECKHKGFGYQIDCTYCVANFVAERERAAQERSRDREEMLMRRIRQLADEVNSMRDPETGQPLRQPHG